VVQARWGLGRTAVKTPVLAVLGVAARAAAALGVNELVVLLAAGVIMAMTRLALRPSAVVGMVGLTAGTSGAATAVSAAGAAPFSLSTLFWVFCKIGAVLFGSGYVLLAFLRSDLVERLGWLTERQLLDAVAVGQITPGPVFTTATFVGYLLGRGPGAAIATTGIFLPAFVFVALSGVLLPKLRRSATARVVLDGVNVASLALMAAVTVQLAHAALVDPLTVALAALSALALLRWRVNSAWLVLGGAIVGIVAR